MQQEMSRGILRRLLPPPGCLWDVHFCLSVGSFVLTITPKVMNGSFDFLYGKGLPKGKSDKIFKKIKIISSIQKNPEFPKVPFLMSF